MDEANSTFQSAQELIDWARSAIAEADKRLEPFVSLENFPALVHHGPEAGVSTLVLTQSQPIPSDVRRELTSALNNLRNSFDQSLYAACAAIRKNSKAHYPWADNGLKDLAWKLQGKDPVKPKVPAEFWDLIRSQEPYPTGNSYSGGNDVIRQMATLANSKHTIGFLVGANLESTRIRVTDGAGSRFSVRPQWSAAHNWLEVLSWKFGDPEPKLECNLTLYIGFQALPPLGTIHAPKALDLFSNKAQSVLDGFKARVAELGDV